ncbi:MAG: hypothetical protein NT049_16105, partial [Planctomycetota bacterium]|nr:hypothetical protein [Planctomycetota bacterium]
MPIAQTLDIDALDGIIQGIYSEGSPLDRLLKTFKRMSIGRAPLAERLRLLRDIMKADPQRDMWTEDVRAFEAARQVELVKEGEAADTSGDLRAMESILAELKSSEWLYPPSRFVAAVERIIIPHRRRYAMGRFAELISDLHEAHGRMDEQRCRFLLTQVEAVVHQTAVSPDAATEAAIEPVETWLGQLETARRDDAAFGAACAALELAIDENKDRLALEKLAGAVFRFERGMPELLAARFNSRMEELGRKSKRRFALILTGVIGGVFVLAGLVTAVIVWQSRASERERWRVEIAGALEKGDLEGAERLLSGVADKNPEVAAAPEIVALHREHEGKVQEESGRRDEFQGIQKAVEEKGPENPDPKALERATQLARVLTEKQWVEDWRQKYEKGADEKRRQREDQFRQKLGELKTLHAKFSEAEQARRDDLDTLATPCLGMAKELSGWADVSKSLQAEVAAIERHVTQAMKTFQEATGKRQAVREVLTRLPSLAGNPEELAKTLESFVKNYPEHPLAPDFTKAAGMGPHWRAAQAWRLLVEGWQGQLRVNDGQVALVRQSQVEDYVKQHGGGPVGRLAKDYRAYLTSASAAFADGRLIGVAKVKEVLSHPVFTPALRMIRAKDGRSYYILEKDLKEQRANDKIMGYLLKYMTSTAPAFADRNISAGEIQVGPIPAPQTVFAKAAMARLDQFKGPGWETFYLELAAMAQEQQGMDPVLVGQVLQLVLDFASNTTPNKGDQVKQWVSQFSGENLDFVAWLDPDSSGAEKSRPRVEQILKGMGSLKAVAADVQKNLDGIFASVSAYSPVGIVLNGSGPIQFGQTPPDGK